MHLMHCLKIAVLTTLLTACQFGLGSSGTVTGNDLTYQAPAPVEIKAGETIPATPIRFEGASDGAANLQIAGQSGTKEVADSLDWQGVTHGVSLTLASRIVQIDPATLRLAGTMTLEVPDVSPIPAELPANGARYNALVLYTVPAGKTIPGTQIGYVGTTPQGAELTGVSGFATRKAGDSITWQGQLRPNVWLDLNVRLLRYNETEMTVSGIANIVLGE
jgi:hypothetical protein